MNNRESVAMHQARVFKAGNSLAVRIPSAIAKHCGLEDGSALEMAVDEGTISLRRVPLPSLEELIDAITPENLHAPEFENLTGRERW